MKKYNCKHCGAELYWDANAGTLKCEYCEHEFTPEDFEDAEASATATDGIATAAEVDQGGAEADTREEKYEREADEFDKATDESESADLVVYECEHCGAEVITARSTVATTCAFCGRAISLSNKLVGDFKPESVIPFAVDEKQAVEIYKGYCKKALLSPGTFKSENEIKKVKGVYVPFWLHNFTVNADAVVGAENVSSHKRGDDKVVEHHMFRISMDVKGDFKSIPTDGLKNLDDKLMSSIEPFDYSKLTEFNPAYMAGFYAEEYDIGREDTIAQAKERADDAMRAECIEKAGLYEAKMMESYNPSYTNEVSKYAMLPVWLFNVTYKGKDYQFAVNGETGKIAGKLPISIPKLVGAVLGSGVLTQALALVLRLVA